MDAKLKAILVEELLGLHGDGARRAIGQYIHDVLTDTHPNDPWDEAGFQCEELRGAIRMLVKRLHDENPNRHLAYIAGHAAIRNFTMRVLDAAFLGPDGKYDFSNDRDINGANLVDAVVGAVAELRRNVNKGA